MAIDPTTPKDLEVGTLGTSAVSGVVNGVATSPSQLSSSYTIKTVDVTPVADSGETGQDSEPSLAVNPLNSNQIMVGSFGATGTPFFLSTDGGATWTDYGNLSTLDKSLAWQADGSAALAVTLTTGLDIQTYSGTTSGSFGLINTYAAKTPDNLDQPWIRTGPSNHVYVSYNNLNNFGALGKTAEVNVSTDGGRIYTPVIIDKVGAGDGQDSPAVRTAVNGSTVYGAFIRWDSFKDSDSLGEDRFNAHVVVVRSDNGGSDSFSALGTGGNGTSVAADTAVFANTTNGNLTVGQERTGGGLAIAVDPQNANRVFVAYENSTGAITDGKLQLIVAESDDGGSTWTTKYTTSSAIRSGQPAVAIATNGAVGFLYDSYDPLTDKLSQHLVTTTDDFASATDTILGNEKNSTPKATFSPYLGDYFDLQAVGNTFEGVFSASNADNGSDAVISNVTYQRDFTGAAGSSNFQLTDSTENPVANSIDTYFFTATPRGPPPPPSTTPVVNLLGHGKSNLLMQDASTGGLQADEVSGGQISSNPFGSFASPPWNFEGFGDFLAQGRSGYLLWNSTTGAVDAVEGGVEQTISRVGSDFQFEGTGDFLGQGRDGFLLWNSLTGETDFVESGNQQPVAFIGSQFKFKATGDFLGDGRTGFLLWNSKDDTLDLIESGNQTALRTILGPKWQFEGSGDVLGHGKDDFLIFDRNGSGEVDVAEVTGSSVSYTKIATLGSQWQFLGVGDYDGKSDGEIMLLEKTTGDLYLGTVSGGSLSDVKVGNESAQFTFYTGNVDNPTVTSITLSAATAAAADATIITPSSGDQTLAAGPGPTLFDFSDVSFGSDAIVGFDASQDAIRLNSKLAPDFTTVSADISATAAGTSIALDNTHSITLSGVSPSSLSAANFRFS